MTSSAEPLHTILGNLGLSIPWLVKLCIVLLFSNAFIKAIYNVYFHPLKNFPGPWLAKATPFPYVWRLCNGEMVNWTTKLHLQYGDVVRVMPDEISCTAPSAWSEIFLSRPQLPKPEIGTIVNVNGVRPIVHTLTPHDHLRQRKVLNYAFTSKALKMQEHILQQYVKLLVKRFDEFATSGAEIDISDWYQFLSFDVIGDLVFGESFKSLESSKYHPWIDTLFSGLKAGSIMTSFAHFPVLRLLGRCIPNYIKNILRLPLYKHFQYSIDHVKKRMARKTERPDVMKFVLEHNTEGGMSMDELCTQMQLLVFAGSGTVAATVAAATWFLLKNPDMMQRLQRELREAFQTPEEIDVASASKLPYLHAIIQEALRLHTAAATSNPRYVDRPITVAGYHVPPGVRAGIPQQTAYQLPWNFKDPHVFAPERWLPEGEAKYSSDRKAVLEPFMVGQRNCIGKSLAWAEMELVLSHVFWNFELELSENTVPDWTKQKVFLTYQKLPLMVRVHGRKGATVLP